MQKILICIPNYTSQNEIFLIRALHEFDTFEHEIIDIIIYTTYNINLPEFKKIHVKQKIYDQSIKQGLVFQCRNDIYLQSKNYDYFLYVENDILITYNNFNSWKIESSKLPNNYTIGFLRYELNSCDMHFIDMNKKYKTDINFLHINKSNYFTIYNKHQGCFILSKEQLTQLIHAKIFSFSPAQNQMYGILEMGATDVYLSNEFIKIIPYDNLINFCVHHMPNKYINLGGLWSNPGCYTFLEMLNLKK